ncbi:RNA-binding protein 15 [Oncorhynchus masou masou]|uniref:RNA-binding protein 15 n=1 Tax=Oncorhynchus masou masou TaxID=90313 RepID=UPI003182F4FF
MKGKERSPIKKRSRVLDDIRDRGGGHPPSKKMGAISVSSGSNNGNSSTKSDAGSTRRSLLGEKRDRDFDGHVSSRSGVSNHSYPGAIASAIGKNHNLGLTLDLATARTSNSRGERALPPPINNESEYKTLKISELGTQLSDEDIEDGLFHEFKKFGDVSVKISRSNDERIAFVNFRKPEDARAAKHARGRLVLYDRPLRIDAVYINRRRSRSPVERVDRDPYVGAPGHRHLHTQRPLSPSGLGYRDYRLQQLALGRLPPPPLPPLPRDLEREREFALFEARSRPGPAFIAERAAAFREEDFISPEDDQRANRTLFLGNLDITVTETDLRRAFDRFGVITEVDIKPTRGQTSTYGFLKFENLDMAHRAKLTMSGKIVGRNPIKIGYGKATPTTRLWVGGLGPWVPLAALAREFDRFGTIRTIDYRKGDTWAYIQYESLDAAQAACTHMRGFPLGGPERRLRVDFADTEHHYQQQFLQPLPLPPFDMVAEAFIHRATAEPLRDRERTPPPLHFRERDLGFPGAEWPPNPAMRERVRPGVFELPDHLQRDRRPGGREPWSLERELVGRGSDPGRKRRLMDDGRHLDVSPDSTDRTARRRRGGPSPDGSPDGGRFSDSERPSRGDDRPSPGRDRRPSLERPGGGDRRLKNQGNLAERGASSSGLTSSTGERKRKAGDSSSRGPGAKRDRSSDQGGSKGSQSSKLSLAWHGMLLLKNSNFPANMHLLEGHQGVAKDLLVDGPTGRQVGELKITQRLRLDQPKLDEVSRRIKAAGPGGYAVLLAVPGSGGEEVSSTDPAASTQRPLRNLVSYLKQKQAAGVISLPVGGSRDKDHQGVLHAFPPCEFSQQFIDASAKALAKTDEDYLVMVVVRGPS